MMTTTRRFNFILLAKFSSHTHKTLKKVVIYVKRFLTYLGYETKCSILGTIEKDDFFFFLSSDIRFILTYFLQQLKIIVPLPDMYVSQTGIPNSINIVRQS